MMNREVTCTVKKVFYEKMVRGNKVRLQVVQWNNGAPTVEKREYWIDKAGIEKTGKAKGLNAEDFDILFQNPNELTALIAKTGAGMMVISQGEENHATSQASVSVAA